MFSKLFKHVNSMIIRSPRSFSTAVLLQQISRPVMRPPPKLNKTSPLGWFLLIIPASTFGLGTWQVQRKQWKESLLADLQSRTACEPVNLPQSLDEISQLEYKPVRVRGHFIHEKELYMGPRSLLVAGDASTKSSLISGKTNKAQGYLVITPFKLADRDETILVNRGWVPSTKRDPRSRQKGQIKEETNLIGVVRLQENRPTFSLKNQEGSNIYFYRDLEHMSHVTGTAPIYLDATEDYKVADGPIPGQTRISLRNEHMSYILTWYSLCAATSLMWYKKFLK